MPSRGDYKQPFIYMDQPKLFASAKKPAEQQKNGSTHDKLVVVAIVANVVLEVYCITALAVYCLTANARYAVNAHLKHVQMRDKQSKLRPRIRTLSPGVMWKED